MRKYTFGLSATSLLILTAFVTFFSSSNQALALSGSQFKPGNIINNSIFYRRSSMSSASIQKFLNSKVPSCDTNGSKMYNSTKTRAQYGKSKGNPAPYTCLKNKVLNRPARSASEGLCSSISSKSNQTAAQIIYTISNACNVDSKVLLVMLQKEQSLITDDWPWSIQYRSAMGYGCPDTAACDSHYYGFFNQVYNAAKQLRRYSRDPADFNYRAGRTNYIQYNPNASCGGKNVYIDNSATAALYNYTPYVPNTAALNNLYGSGNSCSAYGNRNFWRMYNDWFGSTQKTTSYNASLFSQEEFTNSGRTQKFTSTATVSPGGKIYLTLKFTNTGDTPWDQSWMRLGTTHPIDRTSLFYDSSWTSPIRPASLLESTVVPGDVGTFNFTLTAPENPGTYNEHFNPVAENRRWFSNLGVYVHINVVEPIEGSTDIKLNAGESLLPNNFIISPDKQSTLTLQKDGNLVLYRNFKAVWSTRTTGKKAKFLAMQNDGNLVLYDNNYGVLWHSRTSGHNNSKLSLQSDGNLVIYSAGNSPLWDTNTDHRPNLLSYVNTTLPVAKMLPGQQLQTADRRFRLAFQTDGNVVLYSPNRATWSSRTHNKKSAYLILQKDGNLVLYDKNYKVLWKTNTANKGGKNLILQQDGNLVLYKLNGRAVWSTKTNGKE